MKSYYAFILKSVLVLASLWFIYRQVMVREDFLEAIRRYSGRLNDSRNLAILALVVLMMAVNWLLEAQKWRFLLRQVTPVSLSTSIRAVVSGITISFFTPNRIGEYAGRVLLLESGNRIKAVVATVVGSMNQLLVTVAAGTVALLFILPPMLGNNLAMAATAVLLVTGLFFIWLAYFNISGLYPWLSKFRILEKAEKYMRVLKWFNRPALLRVTLWSVLRYLIFTIQFILLLDLFGISAGIAETSRQIALSFLILAIVPTFALTELAVRGSVALYCLEPLSPDSTGILAASAALWFINLVIPAVAGALNLLFIRIFNKG